MSAVRKTLGASIRTTQDVWFRNDAASGKTLLQLFPGAALHLVDHHLHSSGIIPHVLGGNYQDSSFSAPGKIYEHDWYCVSQAVSCFPHDALLDVALEAAGDRARTHVWVTSVGNSTLHLGNLITADDQILAAIRRIFVRRFRGKPAPFSDVERYHFQEECAADDVILDFEELLLQHEEQALQQQEQQALVDPNGQIQQSTTVLMPRLERFGTFLPMFRAKPILRVRVGPQDVNFGNHADHAFLAETAFEALSKAKLPVDSIAINYLSEAKLGHVLECRKHEDRIFVVRYQPPKPDAPADKTGKRILVLVAKGTPR